MILLIARLEVLIGGPLKSIWEEAHNKLGLVMSRPRATLQGTFSIRPITLLCITSGYTAHTVPTVIGFWSVVPERADSGNSEEHRLDKDLNYLWPPVTVTEFAHQ